LGLLGDPTRRVIFELLARRPSSVQELADQLPISRPAVSQHLRVLKDGGLVISQAEGTRRIYRLNPDGVGALRSWLDGVWGDALAGFQKAAETAGRLDHDENPNQEELMTTNAPIPPITATAMVGLPVDQAFRVFTEDFTGWWPHQYHIGEAEVAEILLEPLVDGRWYERGVDGSECDWGRVLVWEPPGRVVFTWQISGAWQFDPAPEHASEIEVLFVEDGPAQTRVEVEHRFFERLDGGQAIHDAIRGGGSWTLLLESYAKSAANAG
jgi:DNA-binding transcriptional ArsR family regulator